MSFLVPTKFIRETFPKIWRLTRVLKSFNNLTETLQIPWSIPVWNKDQAMFKVLLQGSYPKGNAYCRVFLCLGGNNWHFQFRLQKGSHPKQNATKICTLSLYAGGCFPQYCWVFLCFGGNHWHSQFWMRVLGFLDFIFFVVLKLKTKNQKNS